jgi:3-dehydroquinate dehydratase
VSVLVIVPHDHAGADTADTRRYRTAADIAGLLELAAKAGEAEGAIIVSDGIAAEELDAVAAAVRGWTGTCIEVRGAAWDGTTFSPLSAACKGVISGFGDDGLRRALELR